MGILVGTCCGEYMGTLGTCCGEYIGIEVGIALVAAVGLESSCGVK